jgi:hypothetical protein
MSVLADPNGPLEETVPAQRPITLRDLLTFTLGTGMVPAEPGTVPIADALNASLGDEPGPPPDEWIRRLGALPLVYQPGTGAGRRRSKTVAAGSSRPPAITSPSPRPSWPAAPTTVSGCSRGRR